MAGGHAWWRGMHGQGGMCGGGHAWQGGMHGGGHVWWGGMCGREACMARGHVWQGVCMPRTPPLGHYEIRSANARAVRILLECILVSWPICEY